VPRSRGSALAWRQELAQQLGAWLLVDAAEPEAPIVSASPALLALVGFAACELEGAALLALCGPDTDGRAMRQAVLSLRSQSAGAVRLLCYRRDGAPFWCSAQP
jgi:hypothetical protein